MATLCNIQSYQCSLLNWTELRERERVLESCQLAAVYVAACHRLRDSDWQVSHTVTLHMVLIYLIIDCLVLCNVSLLWYIFFMFNLCEWFPLVICILLHHANKAIWIWIWIGARQRDRESLCDLDFRDSGRLREIKSICFISLLVVILGLMFTYSSSLLLTTVHWLATSA